MVTRVAGTHVTPLALDLWVASLTSLFIIDVLSVVRNETVLKLHMIAIFILH